MNDRYGHEVKVGDIVWITGKITSLLPNTEGDNVIVAISCPGVQGKPNVTMNTAGLERVSSETIQQAAERGFRGL